MKPLELTFEDSGWKYKQLKRKGKVVMYELKKKHVTKWNVARVRKQELVQLTIGDELDGTVIGEFGDIEYYPTPLDNELIEHRTLESAERDYNERK